MALISCPECLKEISDKAKNCPNCGYPLEERANVVESERIDIAEEEEDNTTREVELTSINTETEEKLLEDNPTSKSSILWFLIVVVVIGISVLIFQDFSYQHKLNQARKKIESLPKSASSEGGVTTVNTSINNGNIIESLLIEFKDWEGNKDLDEPIYTLNLDNDKYILTIKPNIDNKQELDWIEMIYIKLIEEDTIITLDEIKPLEELVSFILPYWVENNQWIDNILSKDFPFEELIDSWNLKADYYVYQGKNEGIYIKINNSDKAVAHTLTNDIKADKRQELAKGIKDALNASGHPAICTSVYFNKEGELIIEATSYWSDMSESDREDIVFLIKGILSERKEELGVEGYGQFFSPAGRGLESFYAK